jgi:thiamine monophosphate kinase
MDTSDGALTTLDELMLRSGVGFRLTVPVTRLLHPAAAHFARTFRLPAWVPLAGPHGEFELVFTIPQSRLESFREASEAAGIDCLRLGVVTRDPGLILSPEDGNRRLPTGRIRALAERATEDTGVFVARLREIDGNP